jgi:hypothetical protein
MTALILPLTGVDLLWGVVAAVLFVALLGRIARSPR